MNHSIVLYSFVVIVVIGRSLVICHWWLVIGGWSSSLELSSFSSSTLEMLIQHHSTLEMDQSHQRAPMQVIECTTISFQLHVLWSPPCLQYHHDHCQSYHVYVPNIILIPIGFDLIITQSSDVCMYRRRYSFHKVLVGLRNIIGAILRQIRSFFEHCSKSLWPPPPSFWTSCCKFFLMNFLKSA